MLSHHRSNLTSFTGPQTLCSNQTICPITITDLFETLHSLSWLCRYSPCHSLNTTHCTSAFSYGHPHCWVPHKGMVTQFWPGGLCPGHRTLYVTEPCSVAEAVMYMEVIPLLKIDVGVLPLPSHLGKAEPAKELITIPRSLLPASYLRIYWEVLYLRSCHAHFPQVPRSPDLLYSPCCSTSELLPTLVAHKALLRTAG